MAHEEEMLRLAAKGLSVNEVQNIVPDLEKIKSSLYFAKSVRYPKLPRIMSDIEFKIKTKTEVFMKTFQEEGRFLLADVYEDNQRITIFCSDLQLRIA